MTGRADRWIRWMTTGCVALLALIAATVSYLHMHRLVEMHGQPGWVAALTPFSVDGVIVAASTTLLADSRSGGRGGILPWVLLVIRQRGEPCCQCSRGRANGGRTRDRRMAVVRADRGVRAAHASSTLQRCGRRWAGGATDSAAACSSHKGRRARARARARLCRGASAQGGAGRSWRSGPGPTAAGMAVDAGQPGR